jgi:D-alanyl-D-alanine carboxypeptidase
MRSGASSSRLLLGVLLVASLVGCSSAVAVQASPPAASMAATATPPPAPSRAPAPSLQPSRGALAERVAISTLPSRAPQPAPAVRRVTTTADYCVDRDVPADPVAQMVLVVLDRTHMLPTGYAPGDLVPASRAGFTGSSGTKLVRSAMLDDLTALRRDSSAAGLRLILQSTYRSYASQVSTFRHWVAVYGYAGALLRSARPGHSEHQLGTTIDFNSPGWGDRFGDWARQTAEGAWLARNGWRYGFVMSYPAGSQSVTCFSYEPWHYRWIGREAAAAWHASGQFLHPFLDSLAP